MSTYSLVVLAPVERHPYVDASNKIAKDQSKDAMRMISIVEKGALSAVFLRRNATNAEMTMT